MASGFFALLDDIATLADDVSVAAKIATQKTTAVLGDDLAVNAEKATGFQQSRELTILWAITKGSLKNKAIILPIAFLLNWLAPSIIIYFLMAGGFYLLYEGSEKVVESIAARHHKKPDKTLLQSTTENILDLEKQKIKSAIFTDFILSIEIIVIALSSVANATLLVQMISTVFVALFATFGVYGIVALIVRMDNFGFWLIGKKQSAIGKSLIRAMPKLIRVLGFVGTVAMILVGGGILTHHITWLHHFFIPNIPAIINDLVIGLVIGFIVFLLIEMLQYLKSRVLR
ncbi:DUF808 domain-containing protein [Sulfurospirillum sp. 1612]|uniref:DUF808 domain-containing protein n=1 Tax=Sulfurospirillum sp. 1612 TaxID=3094835 RepID=UPI002F94F6D3